jgi:tyrosyl-tRNA synthetase
MEQTVAQTENLQLSDNNNNQAAALEEATPVSTFQISIERVKELQLKETLTAEEKFELVRSIGEECIQDEELRTLLAKKPNIIAYDGFEPSGRMHIAQGILKSINVNKLTKSGCKFIFWVADWFALLNNKMGGDLKKIRTVGEYMIEVWKACGMDMTNVQFVWSSDEINSHSNEYWLRVVDISRRFKLPRIKRCSTIMGREDEEELYASQILYPCMQCADIFHLKADICQLGLDQRKVNMLAREYCDEVKIKFKPIILSHHMLMGLGKGQAKMSKSDPNSAIFMEDTEADVNVKIKQSYCPPNEVKDNPLFDYLKHIIFPKTASFTVERKEENGGNKTYARFEDIVADYEAGQLHPGDLKPALAKALNDLIRPVREHFQNDPNAKKLLEQVKKFKVTR